MFWGCILKEGQPYKVKNTLEDREFPVLHLSNAALSRDSKKGEGKTYVTVSLKNERKDQESQNLKNLVVAVLDSEGKESQALDLYFNVQQEITLSCQGKGSVHLSGYFEPNQNEEMYPGDMMADYDDEEEGEDELNAEDEDSDSEEDADKKIKSQLNKKKDEKKDVEGFQKGGDLDKSLTQAKKNAMKNTMPEESDDDYDEEGEDDDFGDLNLGGEEGEEDMEMDSDEMVSSGDEDEAVKKVEEIKNKNQKKVQSKPVAADSDDESDDDDEGESSEEDLAKLMKRTK